MAGNERRSGARSVAACAAAALLVVLLSQPSQSDPDSRSCAQTLQHKYVGSYDTDAFLNEPVIKGELEQLLGEELEHFRENLDVRGSVDLLSGSLLLAGNARHGGGIEEAVLCVSTYDESVSAAILSEGHITIYSRLPDYAQHSLCIKDWITQANSGHQDRFVSPRNVTIVNLAGDRTAQSE